MQVTEGAFEKTEQFRRQKEEEDLLPFFSPLTFKIVPH